MKKKILAFALALSFALFVMPAPDGFAARAETAFTPADSYDVGERSFNAGAVELTLADATSGSVDTVRYAGIEGKDYTDEKVYTLRDSLDAASGMDWNPHTWKMDFDALLVDMTTMGLYTFELNEDCTGYAVIPEMAADYPVDVTGEYAGTLGVSEGETAKAWRIALNPDARWDNGDPITADDYIYSMQQLLNPKMLNRRADSFYAGQLIIYNAKNYLYSGKTAYNLIEGSAEALLSAGREIFLDMDFWGLTGAEDAEGNAAARYVSVADDTLYRDASVEDEADDGAWMSAKSVFENYLAEGMPYADYQGQYLYTADIAPKTPWDDVGLKKVDDYTIDLILAEPLEEAAFYLPYNLGTNWLVYRPLYEACKSFYDAEGKPVKTEEEAATVTTDYCRSLEKSVSYAPYKLTYFELDKQIVFGRNENWYGYSDGKHLGMYQTDIYSLTVIPEHATKMLAFLSGDLDSIGLRSEDMDKYASSAYIDYSPSSYTTKVTFNTDYEKLLSHGTGSQILVVDEFREAFAFAIDRQHFVTAFTSSGTVGFGLLNNSYIYNPFTGSAYRSSEAAKKAMAETYGLTWGEGGDYATLDEACEAMTAYDMEKARALMETAYQKAVDAGIYDGKSQITLDFRLYQNDTVYVQMFTYLDEQLKAACEGTGFEGKISMTMTVDPDFYQSNYSGKTDVIFTVWGGASMDPFSIFGMCYTDASDGSGNQMEYGYDTSAIALTFNIDGEDLTASLQDWSKWASRETIPGISDVLGSFTDYSYETRCAFTAGMEACLLHWHACTPIYYQGSASLRGQKIEYASNTYVNSLVGRGGMGFLTYNYDDEAWARFIAENELTY